MVVTRRVRLLYLTHFSKPPADRVLYRAIRRQKVRRILELGLGTAQRAARMIELAALDAEPGKIQYAGVDPFESRHGGNAPELSVKAAYRALAATGARVRLCPGDPYLALSQAANSLGQADLIVISSEVDQVSLARAWFFLPRMLHGDTKVFLQRQSDSPEPSPFRPVPRAEIDTLAADCRPRRAA